MKYDLNSIVELVKDVSTGSSLRDSTDNNNFMLMPDWWRESTGTPGIPYGGYIMLAGDSDSGKTSAAIEAMRAAQDQNCAVLYIETENKTSKNDLKKWGVDPEGIMLVKDSVAESLYKKTFDLIEVFVKTYPDGKLLIVYDSVGNVLSKHDLDMDISEDNQKPGGKGKTNRLGLSRLITASRNKQIATLIVNYTYDNIGSPGKTNAGGRALNFYSSLTYQTSRKAWIERTVKGKKIRIGAKVQWKLFKNHINKDNPGPKVIELDITSEGIKYVGSSED